MPHADERFSTMLSRYLGRHGEAPGDDVSSAVGRVWRRLEPHALHLPAHLARRATSKSAGRVTLAVLAAAAVFVLAATPLIREWTSTNPARAVVDSADGSVYRTANGEPAEIPVGGSINTGETIRTNGNAGAVLALSDGSRVEMRTQSELSLERADDGIRIRLRSGSIIVNAAKQRTGHLYVQTKDMSVSVVGTIFLVNVENAGSSVAVIEGEVRVRETKGTIDTKLRPGQQVSSSPALVTRPVKEEIAWSRNAATHISILDAFMSGMAATRAPLVPIAKVIDPAASPQNSAASASREFEEASIRRCDPDNLPSAPEGARGGGPNSLQMTPGRFRALCLTLATLVRTAYNFSPADLAFMNPGGRGLGMRFDNVYSLGVEDGRRVKGGPDWVRNERYTIEAIADATVTAETMRTTLLRALLERRFNLLAHIESEEIPAFALVVAPGGLKMKEGTCTPADPQAAPEVMKGTADMVRKNLAAARRGETTVSPCGYYGAMNGPNMLFVGAGAGVPRVGPAGVPVLDRTGIPPTVRFNYTLEYARDDAPTTRDLPPGIQIAADPASVPRAPDLFTALEQQLGLRLEPTKAPREFIVIDRVERLSPN